MYGKCFNTMPELYSGFNKCLGGGRERERESKEEEEEKGERIFDGRKNKSSISICSGVTTVSPSLPSLEEF